MAEENNTEIIRLGSGKLYVLEYTGQIPPDATLETEENLLGRISGGASVEYKPEFYTETDDSGTVSKTVLTKEEATLKSGVITFNGNTLAKLSSTARVTENATTHKRTVKIGGLQNQDGKKYVIRFLHEDKKDGDVRVTIVGLNQSGFTMAFAKDKSTVVDAEFKAEPNDTDGTRIIFEEDILTAA